jgi:hypothetical protein
MVDKLKELIYLFCKSTCMEIKFSKYLDICWGLFEPEKLYINQIFPFKSSPFKVGLKYFGFHLKENIHLKKVWIWILAKTK